MNMPAHHAPRAAFLDWLRIAAIGLLIVYHVAAYYARWPWHANSLLAAGTGPWVEPLMQLSSPWRMSLLFGVSGAATACMLGRGGSGGSSSGAWLRTRARRLLLPLLLGVFVIVAPQSWIEVRERFGYTGSFTDFMLLYWSGYGGFADARGRLILPTWNHLWFLPYLFTYTAALWLLLRWRPRALQQAAAALPRGLRGARLALLPPLVPLLSLGLAALFGRSHALVDDPSSHLLYGSAFALGALLGTGSPLWARLGAWGPAALAVALAAWALALMLPARTLPWAVAHSIQAWAALLAVLGLAWRHWDRDHPWRATLAEAVFPVYLVHQTVTLLLAVALRPLALPPLAEGALLIAGTFGGGALFYLAVRPWRRLRPWVGLGALAVAATAASLPARAQATPAGIEGEWWTPGFASRVRLAPCAEAPQRLCGQIVWLWDEAAAVPDGQPLLQRQVVEGFRRDEGRSHWSGGQLHDPESGRRYEGSLHLCGAGRLEVEGCVWRVCRRQVWRRFDARRVPPVAP